MAKASTSMSKRAPKAEAKRWRRAAQPSAPSSSRAAPAMAASSHRSGAPSGSGSIGSGGNQAGDPGANQRNPVGHAEPRMRMVGGQPALDGDQQAGKQQQAAEPPRCQLCPRTGTGVAAKASPKERDNRTGLAHQGNRGKSEWSGSAFPWCWCIA